MSQSRITCYKLKSVTQLFLIVTQGIVILILSVTKGLFREVGLISVERFVEWKVLT